MMNLYEHRRKQHAQREHRDRLLGFMCILASAALVVAGIWLGIAAYLGG